MSIKSTVEMAEAAQLDLELHGVPVTRETAWQAVDAALAVADEPVPAPAPSMSRADILEKAAALVDKQIAAAVAEGTKGNGYKADSFRYPTLAERTDAILNLASFMATEGR